jgi:hypothetical protein
MLDRISRAGLQLPRIAVHSYRKATDCQQRHVNQHGGTWNQPLSNHESAGALTVSGEVTGPSFRL